VCPSKAYAKVSVGHWVLAVGFREENSLGNWISDDEDVSFASILKLSSYSPP
jgi:hypothetical protein